MHSQIFPDYTPIKQFYLFLIFTQTPRYPDKSFQVHLLFPLMDKQHSQTQNICHRHRPSGLLHTEAFRLHLKGMQTDCHTLYRHRSPLMNSSVPRLNQPMHICPGLAPIRYNSAAVR